MGLDKSDKIPLSRALLWIFLSTLMVSGLAWLSWLYYLQLNETRIVDDQYQIVAIVQSSSHHENLKTVYLAELLNLAVDKPQNLFNFDLNRAHKRLMASPLIKNATIKKIRPGTIFVEYSMRMPYAFLGDYTNTAVDWDGYLFPFTPFFTPKKLPIIYLGLEGMDKKWGQSIYEDEGFQLALNVIEGINELFAYEPILLKQIDVSQAFADSYGQKQIVIIIEDVFDQVKNGRTEPITKTYLLRLNTEKYMQNLANYLMLRGYISNKLKEVDALAENVSVDMEVKNGVGEIVKPKKPSIIDLRISHLAFLKDES
ncbi:MAG: FtsQ-type POTRA domain-containing protein [Parachlamydiaceae bacterium]|nr:FtsQ-type POTRA domain-containing protein [Parachlamydiaceae bacterium]